jgi:uncharacterized protein
MTIVSLVCTALLAALVFGLGANVTRMRAASHGDGSPYPSDPTDPLMKAIRAHGSAAEYVPTLIVLFLVAAVRAPDWTLVFVVGATAARLLHAWGLLTSRTLAVPSRLREVGAAGTYLFGIALVVTVLATL